VRQIKFGNNPPTGEKLKISARDRFKPTKLRKSVKSSTQSIYNFAKKIKSQPFRKKIEARNRTARWYQGRFTPGAI